MILGVIPARYASTRLPGKPLVDIGGKPMIQHTYEQACKSKLLDAVIIATDDIKVQDAVENFGGKVLMTPPELPSGSDRIAYIIKDMDVDIVVNIQGDEPFINPEVIDMAIEPLAFDPSVYVSTLAKRIDRPEILKSPSNVKVVFDNYNNAMYFSRSQIPFVRDAQSNVERLNRGEFYKHIGLYVYRKEALMEFTRMPQSFLESLEKLEQLRFIENEIKIKIVITDEDSLSVDTPEDLKKARNFYKQILKERSGI